MAEDIQVVSPATGELVGRVPDVGAEGVAAAMARARAAAPAWAALPVRQRSAALRRWRDALLDEPRVLETLVRESGKPRHEAEAFELFYFCELVRFAISTARRSLREETVRPFLFVTKRARILRRPLGVVAVIGPWNFPILNNAADAIAPLAAGNAVILKPSEVTPLTSVLVGELWSRAGNPPDVFQVVTGRGETGAALVEAADGVMFTGSVATGRKVAARAGERLVPCVTELGGKGPFVVLGGADLPRAVEAAAWSSFMNSGQVCIRTERILVQESIAPRFEELLAERVKGLRQRAPDPTGAVEHDLGSVTFARQREVAERHLDDAVAKGARVLVGGNPPAGSGLVVPPTLLAGATPGMAVAREETFGPLVPVLRVKDAEEAVRIANDSHLGLNASVFGPQEKACEVARRLESGNVIVNDVLVNYFVVEAPLGGWKESGLGARHGSGSIRQWTRASAITTRWPLLSPVDRLLSRWLAFPYRRRVLAVLRRATRVLYGSGLKRKFGPLP